MNSWEISSSSSRFGCVLFLCVASNIINQSVLRLESTEAHWMTTEESVGFQKQLFAKVNPQDKKKKKKKLN